MNRFRSSIQRGIVLPVALAVRGELSAYAARDQLRLLEKDRSALDALRAVRLQGLLRHASTTVPLYQRMGASDLDLCSFKPLEKNDLVDHADELRSSVVRRADGKTTGGSTGRAVTVWKDPGAIANERAATWLAFEAYGIRAGDSCMRFWGTGGNRRRAARAWLADLAMNRTTASAFAFTDDDVDRYWIRIRRRRPDYVYGYVSMLEVMARRALALGLPKLTHPPKVVITTSEALHDGPRQAIEQAFGAPVRNEYGCGEVGPIAYECPEGTLHLVDANLWVEVVNDAGDPVGAGTSGELLITDLTNLAMPLIRYRVGDSITLGADCPCGRVTTTVDRIDGRSYDFIEDAHGRRYHGEAVMYVFEDLRSRGSDIRQFKVLQRRPGNVEVQIVSGEPPDSAAADVSNLFRQYLGGMEATVELVPSIARSPSGKASLIERL